MLRTRKERDSIQAAEKIMFIMLTKYRHKVSFFIKQKP